MVNNLGDADLTVKLKVSNERQLFLGCCTICTSTYVKGHQRYENMDPTLSFQHLGKSTIVNTIVRLNKRLNQRAEEHLPSISISSDSSPVNSTANLSLKEKLGIGILNDKKCKNKGRLNVSKDLSITTHNLWNIFAKLL